MIERPAEHRTLTGVGLSILDDGTIRRVRISNVAIDGAIAPIQVRLGNAGRGQPPPSPGLIENVLLKDISIRGALGNNLICGLAERSLRNIALENVNIEFVGPSDPALTMDKVPELDSEFPLSQVWRGLPAYGLFCRHVEGLRLSDVSFANKIDDRRPPMILENVRPLEKSRVHVLSYPKDSEARSGSLENNPRIMTVA